MMLTKMKFVSITCEHSIEHKILDVLRKNGIRSTRLMNARIEELDGESSMDLLESQLKIECVVSEDKLVSIVEEFSKRFLTKYDVGFFVSDVEVLRPEIFCNQARKKP
jgi:hypothetical protein